MPGMPKIWYEAVMEMIDDGNEVLLWEDEDTGMRHCRIEIGNYGIVGTGVSLENAVYDAMEQIESRRDVV